MSGCLAEQGFNSSNSKSSMAYDVNKYPLNKVVCDGLDDGSQPPSLYGGLKADLYYRAPGQDRWYSTADYISKGKKSDKFFFFTQLNVPTRLFSLGFPLETGGMVKNDDGQDLIEYFALRFATILKLGANDTEGDYELALLSDDGAVWRVRDDNGVYQAVVSSDGDHSSRLACGANVIHMKRDTELVVQLDYYQGPRTEISLIPLWRKVNGAHQSEPLCGVTGQRVWFDYLNNSEPQQNWKDLMAHGWKVLSRENYEQPNTVAFNPCVGGVTPEIDSFEVNADDGRIYATWLTNIPSTSQLKIVNVDTGEEILTVADNTIVRSHEIYQFNIKPGHYKVQAVSISDTYGKAVSAEVSVTAQ
jgi:hypothetical protein